jgi:serine/threonine protein kinase
MTASPQRTLRHYILTKEINSRDASSVWFGENTLTKTPVCVKIIDKSVLTSLESRTRFFREVSSLFEIRHPFIIELFESLEDDDGRYLIFEWAEKGTLANLLSSKGPMGENNARLYFLQLIYAIEYLHTERNSPHSALSSDNIVLDRYCNIRLIDFGLRSSVLNNGHYSPEVYPLPWAAPELLKGHPCTRASDIWSAGILLYEMVTGCVPFADRPDTILSSEPVYPTTMTPSLVDLLKKMLVRSPEGRINLRAITSHHWFSHTQYGAMLESKFSQQRVNEAVIDKEVVKHMTILKLDTHRLPQQLIDRESTPLTAIYRQLVRQRSMDTLSDLMERVTPQRPTPPFKFQFASAKRNLPPGMVRPQVEQGQTQSRANHPRLLSGRIGTIMLPSMINLPTSQRRMSKPNTPSESVTASPTVIPSARTAFDH